MSDLISRELAMSHPFANGQYDHVNANEDFILGFESYKEWLGQLPSAQPDNRLSKIDNLVEGTIDHFDLDDAMDLLYQIKEVLK